MDDCESIPLSYLSQYYFCQRRAALLLLEQIWNENIYTAEGSAEHEKVHTSRVESHGNILKIYEMNVSSEKLNLAGKCDCIEAEQDKKGIILPFVNDRYTLYPIEYKHGVVRDEREYNVQLCAQAMCLEETFGCKITEGAVFYINSHRRVAVALSDNLREMVFDGARELKNILENKSIPRAEYLPKCRKCSLVDYCMPRTKISSSGYIKKLRSEIGTEDNL